jgi:hypothetical protein
VASQKCWGTKVGLFLLIFLSAGVMAVGCSDKKGEAKTATASKQPSKVHPSHGDSASADFEPTRLAANTAASGTFAQKGMTDISDNPGFFTAQNKIPETPVSQDLDQLMRPILKRLFKDAKLVEDIGEQPPRVDGEVEENKLVYVVRLLLTEAEADQLHKELNEKMKWPASPRLGAKPVHGRKEAGMSLFKSTSLRGYSLVLGVNYETQRITVISYRLGSKYDRLM